ncbi:hypothetical protein [Fictibacillus sp. KU28468]|uniref:hypothetical protein n=1 Tax=Fictibacillus sp. KU28468 TaxID=2991053 RepID=UPI00223DC651|nr:hypothetical protein [Fictibacillus sp. KU28468]UZJ78570.1 hypothetical protein OKX00_20995 [Fictibacillus sp. KU28468]
MSLFNRNMDMGTEEIFVIGANCLLVLGNRFFAVVEIESEVPGVDLEEYVIIRINERTARRLNNAGLELCEVQNTAPRSRNGVEVEFKCIFINRNQAFALFDVENDFDEAVFVKISMEEAKRLIRQGARQCTVIDARTNSNC